MSWLLGIDTSSVDLGVGLFNNTKPAASFSRYVRNSHAEHITPVVKTILESNGISPEDITHLAVTTGPGSFTGLRIGIAFAKGFCFAQNTVICPVSSLEILAYGARTHRGRIVTAIDARNDDVFWASFESDGCSVKRLGNDTVCSAEEFEDIIKQSDTIITDTMGFSRSTVFNFLDKHQSFYPVESFPLHRGFLCTLHASLLLDNKDVWKKGNEILPRYLRLSSAQYKAKTVQNA